MDIFSVLTLCGGLAFFLYGMSTMSKSLEKMAGGKLERLLKKMTAHPLQGLLLGAVITIAIQSSSAVTVMLVGLVNAGVMELGQTIGVIMGSNIGTTMTAWILSLAGLESSNVWVRLLKPENFSPAVALAGILLLMGSKRQRRRDIGTVLIGFAILMYGMELMKTAVSPLAELPSFQTLLTAFNHPLLGVAAGALFTALIQSSSASVGILQALALTGSITFGMAIPIIMGQNIGTCVTALFGAIGVNRSAKQVAAVHISFNVIGTAVGLLLFYGAHFLLRLPFWDVPVTAVGIALCHTVFNVFTTLLLLPFTRRLERLARVLVRSGPDDGGDAFLDTRLLRTPGVAVRQCVDRTCRMAETARQNVLLAMQQLGSYDLRREERIFSGEDKLDAWEDRLDSYLVQVSRHSLSGGDSREVSRLLRVITDLERMGDHAVNIQQSARALRDKQLQFSPAAQAELAVLTAALTDVLDRTLDCFVRDDAEAAAHVEPMEEAVDRLIAQMRERHVRRLRSGECTLQLGFILNDLLTDLERVSDHCSNIAVCVIEAKTKRIDSHAYLHAVKAGGDYARELAAALDRYVLPEA
jgi:phosphate:Na+ symporter